MKIHLMGAELFHANGRTDRPKDTTKVRVAFRNFAKAPKIALPKYILSRSYDRESSCQ
jgi:hypothetical protein